MGSQASAANMSQFTRGRPAAYRPQEHILAPVPLLSSLQYACEDSWDLKHQRQIFLKPPGEGLQLTGPKSQPRTQLQTIASATLRRLKRPMTQPPHESIRLRICWRCNDDKMWQKPAGQARKALPCRRQSQTLPAPSNAGAIGPAWDGSGAVVRL